MMPNHGVVFLVAVDDTLIENDRIQDDIPAAPGARVRGRGPGKRSTGRSRKS